MSPVWFLVMALAIWVVVLWAFLRWDRSAVDDARRDAHDERSSCEKALKSAALTEHELRVALEGQRRVTAQAVRELGALAHQGRAILEGEEAARREQAEAAKAPRRRKAAAR